MIAGANYLLYFNKPDMFDEVSKIIYTIAKDGTIVKQYIYPDNDYIIVLENNIAVAFTQQDTIDLQGRVSIEAQIIYKNTSVVKTTKIDKYINDTLFTEIVPGDFPSFKDDDVILYPPSESSVIVVGGVDDYTKLKNKPIEITSNEVTEIINKIGGLV